MSSASMAAMVSRVITERGVPVSVVILSATPSDALKPWNGPTSPTVDTSVDTLAFFIPITGQSFGFEFKLPNLTENADASCVVLPVDGEDFSDAHILVDNGFKWKVLKTWKLAPSGTTIAYGMVLKK